MSLNALLDSFLRIDKLNDLCTQLLDFRRHTELGSNSDQITSILVIDGQELLGVVHLCRECANQLILVCKLDLQLRKAYLPWLITSGLELGLLTCVVGQELCAIDLLVRGDICGVIDACQSSLANEVALLQDATILIASLLDF